MAPIIKTKKVLKNPLLSRIQMNLEIIHPGMASVSKKEVVEILAKRFKCDPHCVVPYGLRCKFGGNKSTGFALIYDNVEYYLKYADKFTLRRAEVLPKTIARRKGYKEMKRKTKRSRAGDKNKIIKARKIETRQQVIQAKKEFLKKVGV
ncbi:Ribosomal protein L23/L15e core domain [Pseudocohnilembus persalinus]|uniref:Ribosomal protein L23/L15e core domain n=1 Tax=Pseudocohnilembus persalinus TaxID=266149 RepID=A0A0V0QJF8_PSEPJ|nr:Ribosomal protein L23/L15e core domain [Pseudocohnilembus persalinus]|eukprot:KRX02382.1 Ribosomal protein L23/L15e core domain [Pseudocohnilembus persalinus]